MELEASLSITLYINVPLQHLYYCMHCSELLHIKSIWLKNISDMKLKLGSPEGPQHAKTSCDGTF